MKDYDADAEWAGEAPISTSYDPNEFYVASQDHRGHRSTIKVNLPDNIPGQVANLTQRLPQYRNVQDFYRDAIVHRIMALRERFPELQAMSSAFVDELIAESVQQRMMTEMRLLQMYETMSREAEGPVWKAEISMRASMAAETVANPRIAQRLRELS